MVTRFTICADAGDFLHAGFQRFLASAMASKSGRGLAQSKTWRRFGAATALSSGREALGSPSRVVRAKAVLPLRSATAVQKPAKNARIEDGRWRKSPLVRGPVANGQVELRRR